MYCSLIVLSWNDVSNYLKGQNGFYAVYYSYLSHLIRAIHKESANTPKCHFVKVALNDVIIKVKGTCIQTVSWCQDSYLTINICPVNPLNTINYPLVQQIACSIHYLRCVPYNSSDCTNSQVSFLREIPSLFSHIDYIKYNDWIMVMSKCKPREATLKRAINDLQVFIMGSNNHFTNPKECPVLNSQ